jgi:ethanolamine transporter EutH
MRNFLIVFCYVAVYLLAAASLTADSLIILLNGMFIGSLVSLLIVFRALTWSTFRGKIKYSDVSVFTLGLLITLVGIVLGVVASAYNQAADIGGSIFSLAAMGRYAVTAGFLTMAYSPDVGLGFFEGTDRKAIAVSIVCGIITASIIIYAQAYEVLAAL